MPASRPVALVTGGARRVGAQIARRLHAAGYDLLLHYRASAAEATLLADELQQARPHSVALVAADLADLERLPALVDAAIARYGRLDALVNNASAFYPTPVGTITATHWNELFASNAQAPLFLAQAAAPHLRAAQGAIVNLADIYADRPLARHTVYCMAKAALVMLTRSLACELGPAVRVNAIAPGAVLWPEAGGYADPAALIAQTALQRAGSPDDVAEAVRWLLQDARYTTGHTLLIDGGRTLRI